MLKLFSIFFISCLIQASTINVCLSGCTYSTAQAALDASANGDTIILKSGGSYGDLVIPGGRHDLTIKSSRVDEYPRNWRMLRNSPIMALLNTVFAGQSAGWVGGMLGNSVLTSRPGDVTQVHGLVVNDKVVLGGSYYTPYHCAIVDQPPYTTGACDDSRVGYFNIRARTDFANGDIIYFKGRTLPTPLVVGTPYYIINVGGGGTTSNALKFQVSLTFGGPAVVVPRFDPTGQDLVIECPPLPKRFEDVMYVVSTPTSTTLTLSPTLGGPATVWTQLPLAYNGGGLSHGIRITKVAPVYNITFDGLEVFPATDYPNYYPFYVSRDAGNIDGENYNIKVFRSWIHGADDQESFPMTTLSMGGRDLEVGWSVVEGAYSTANDTQGIGFTSTSNVYIHDNEVKGATEGIMSGGNVPWFAFDRNTTGIRIQRNFIWKSMKMYQGIEPVRLSNSTFKLMSRWPAGSNADCDTVSTNINLSKRCFAYESAESAAAMGSAVISRFEWSATAANSTFTVTGSTAGQKGYIYVLGGTIKMDHNFSGSVTCPIGITCTFIASPSFPTASSRLGIAVLATGDVFDGSFFGEMRSPWAKNHIESKYGDNWLIEGNVFHRQSNCDSGSLCQDPAIQFTVATNGSGGGEAVNYAVSSSDSIIRKNIFRHLSAGIIMVGKTFAINIGGTGLAYEFAGFGRGDNNLVENNLFMDLGSNEQTPSNGGVMVRIQQQRNVTIQHNTAVDVKGAYGLAGEPGNNASSSSGALFRSNVITPYRSACTGRTADCAEPAATDHIGNQVNFGSPLVPGVRGDSTLHWAGALMNLLVDSATSRFENNLLMNRAGYFYYSTVPTQYPTGTYQVQNLDVNRDPATLFTNWVERVNANPPNGIMYRSGNYRIAPGLIAAYPAYDTRTIGADIDEIEDLTGRNGIDVELGRPKFSDRVSRQIAPSSVAAVISYIPNGAACSIKIWPNANYSGTPSVDSIDTGTALRGNRVPFTLTGLAAETTYYGKRWCGSEVDVFSFSTTSGQTSEALSLVFSSDNKVQIIIYRDPLANLVTTCTTSPCEIAPFDMGNGTWAYKIDYFSSGNILVASSNITPF